MHITVTTTIQTVYDVPDGVSIERIRYLALPELSDAEDRTDEVLYTHNNSLTEVFYGDQECLSQSVEHSITEC